MIESEYFELDYRRLPLTEPIRIVEYAVEVLPDIERKIGCLELVDLRYSTEFGRLEGPKGKVKIKKSNLNSEVNKLAAFMYVLGKGKKCRHFDVHSGIKLVAKDFLINTKHKRGRTSKLQKTLDTLIG
ncbi:MAG: hypothetical protein AABW84_01160 [Nanoarchaeota archaeon]